jgi:nicotinamide-nucleotide amidase
MSLAAQLVAAASETGAVIATAESCTGGMVAAAITDVAGSSHAFDRGFVTYSNGAKTAMLDVSPALIEAHGAVSEEVARAMAQGALARSDATLAVSVTGIAGPGGSAHKPEGRVCFALAGASRDIVETVDFGALGRDRVRKAARDHALRMLLAAVRS